MQPDLTTKAKQLLARRKVPSNAWFYLNRDWHKQIAFLAAYGTIPVLLWFLDMKMVAVAAAGFFAGAKTRDLRWWVTLSKEWPTTSELLDWSKIETIADSTDASAATTTEKR